MFGISGWRIRLIFFIMSFTLENIVSGERTVIIRKGLKFSSNPFVTELLLDRIMWNIWRLHEKFEGISVGLDHGDYREIADWAVQLWSLDKECG